MANLSSIELKLIKIKNIIGNNGVKSINVWVDEDEPIKVDLLFENKQKRIICNNIEEYAKVIERYDNIDKRIFYEIEKSKQEDILIV